MAGTLSLAAEAKRKGGLILYDPNIRSPHKNQILALRNDVFENIKLADMVRGSDEDFKNMFDIEIGSEAYELVSKLGCDILIYTKSNTGVEVFLPGGMTEYPVPNVETVSTIGAGDSFNAGLIYELFQLEDKTKAGIENNMEQLVRTAISFGSHVCTHYENYVTEAYANQLKRN